MRLSANLLGYEMGARLGVGFLYPTTTLNLAKDGIERYLHCAQ